MAMSERRDPYRGFNFKLEIDGIVRARFRECPGLDEELRTIGGKPKYSNITLKWGVTDDHSLLDWARIQIDLKTQRRNGSIILLDEAGNENALELCRGMAGEVDWTDL
jgi:phage tail-like protein